MALPAALVPLRHPLFRMLWTANVVVSLGVWMQNTGAGWLMTTLDPDPLVVSMVQAATILPIFLLALPAGAIADIVDRRVFILLTQGWMLFVASVLAVLTYSGHTTSWSLLALTFAIGIGTAMNAPAWGSVMAESVPRNDLSQAIALNGVGFNIARAVGPALAGFLVLFGGPALAFGLNAVSYLAIVAVLLTWHRRQRPSKLPREHLLSAMRVGMRFVRFTPVMRASMLRSACFYGPASAPWALLPLVVHDKLHLGAGTFGAMLGLMGTGGVCAGLVLPQIRARLSRNATVLASVASSSTGMLILALSSHWFFSAIAMALFGIGWVAASSVIQGSAQLSAPPWVRARALAIYQLASNGAMVFGTFFWGWFGREFGLTTVLLVATACCVAFSLLVRNFSLDAEQTPRAAVILAPPMPEAVAPELASVVTQARSRVLEWQKYRIDPADHDAFLAAMVGVRDARGRAGAVGWQLYEDVSHPEGWIEIWTVENWTDHLREAVRTSEADRAVLARALAFNKGEVLPPARYIAVAPHRLPIVALGAVGK
jgi:MFS family permease